MQSSARLVVVFLFIQVLTACSVAPIYQSELQPYALNKNSVGIAWLSRCQLNDCLDTLGVKGNFTPDGVSGLLDLAIVNSSHGYLEGEVQKLDATRIVEKKFLSEISLALQAQGISAPVSFDAYSPQSLKTSGRVTGVLLQNDVKGERLIRNDGNTTRRVNQLQMDLQPIADKLQVEQVIVLEMLEYGVKRNFGPFAIPISPSYAVGAVRGFLLDITTGETLLNDYAYYEIEPEYTTTSDDEKSESRIAQLMSTVDTALELAIADVTNTLVTALDSSATN